MYHTVRECAVAELRLKSSSDYCMLFIGQWLLFVPARFRCTDPPPLPKECLRLCFCDCHDKVTSFAVETECVYCAVRAESLNNLR